MPVQPNLFPGKPGPTLNQEFNLEPPPPIPAKEPIPEPGSNAAPIWFQRICLFVLVLFCVYLGLFVAFLPWTSVWDHNLLLQSRPWLWSILRLGAVRGIISGLGILDIWIGISEAIHYRDDRP